MNLYQPTITGSLSVSGSVNISGSITIAGGGTISGTASIATTALTASFVENAQTASYVLNAVSSSFALTASSADNLLVRNTLTAQTLVVQTITSSVDFVTGSTRFGSSLSTSTHQFTGSIYITGSAPALQISSSNYALSLVGGGATRYAGTISNTNGNLDFGIEGSAGNQLFTGAGSYESGIGTSVAKNFHLVSNSTVRMTVSASGNVGIGTSTPGTKLDVSGSIRAIGQGDPSSGTGAELFYQTSTTSSYIQSYDRTNSLWKDIRIYGNTLHFGSQGTNHLTITSTGNVGIGITNPSRKLEVVNSSNGYSAGISGTTYGIRFDNGGSYAFGGSTIHGVDNTLTGTYQILGLNGSEIVFGTSYTERMRIASAGQIYTTNAPLGDWSMRVIGNSTAGQSFGFKVLGGTNSADLAFSVTPQNGSTNYFFIRGDGYMFSSPTYNNLWAGYSANTYVAGDGSFGRTTPSSIRYKENINDWSGNGLDTILALKPKTFKYKKDYCDSPDNIDFLGLIAEEVAEVSPYLAQYENPDRTGLVENVRYDTIVVPLIKAIQELKAEFDEYKTTHP